MCPYIFMEIPYLIETSSKRVVNVYGIYLNLFMIGKTTSIAPYPWGD
jgi:hypothetical protein